MYVRAKNNAVFQDLLKRIGSVHLGSFGVAFENLLDPVEDFRLLLSIRVFLKIAAVAVRASKYYISGKGTVKICCPPPSKNNDVIMLFACKMP